MRKVAVHDAIGLILGHDITEIRPEANIKRRAFRRGHVIAAGDIERLLDLGKSRIFVAEESDTDVHEDDAARTVAPAAAGPGISHDAEPSEGKISFTATCDGVLRIDTERLLAINSLGPAALPTLPGNYPVRQGQKVAAFRIIPLTCAPAELDAIMASLETPLLRIDSYQLRTAAILVTGTEVFEGRIKDGFVPRLTATLATYDVPVVASQVVPDDLATIEAAIVELSARCDLLLVTGGTSVDPDDVTAAAMAGAGVTISVRGTPVQPGNNLTVGYRGDLPVCAVPAAALFHQATALDLLLPRILAGEKITPAVVAPMGLGGLAQPDTDARFPDCTFGAGGWR